tara:strand:- start:144 stop:770 length:627 start_codon:yes stop_codon:yes gene_type:complete
MNTIGYFGDSFCADKSKNSWCTILAEKLNCKVVNTGVVASSIWTAILDFNRLKIKPTYSIFCWTDPYRIYNNSFFNLEHNIREMGHSDVTVNKKIQDAIETYKIWISDNDKDHVQYEYVLKYFDQKVLKPLQKSTMIYQCWSFKPFELVDQHQDIQLTAGKFDNISLYQIANKKSFLDNFNVKKDPVYNHMSAEQNIEFAERVYKILL